MPIISIFPQTAVKGAISARASVTCSLPISPACHITSTSLKYIFTLGLRCPCVSDIMPTFVITKMVYL